MKPFANLNEVYDCYGKDQIIPVTNLKQIIFYTAKYQIQPKWTSESSENKGHIVCFFHKGETRLAYEKWLENRPDHRYHS